MVVGMALTSQGLDIQQSAFERFGDWLCELREQRGESWDDLSRRIGVSWQHLMLMEIGEIRALGWVETFTVAEALGLDAEEVRELFRLSPCNQSP
jgi:transcriptional regulator with XRE-family HTH domain